jgi:trehalose 6-phosphate phosphatase
MVDETPKLLRTWSEAPGFAAILTDIDGTLAPIVPTPEVSEVPAEIKEPLRRLSERYLLVTGISEAREVERVLGLSVKEMVYFRNHGFEIVRVGVASEKGSPEITAEAYLVVDGVEGISEVLRELLKE